MTANRISRAPRFSFGLLCGAALTLGLQALADNGTAPNSVLDNFRQIVQVWDRIKAEYVTPVTDERLRDGCLNGMLAGLDARSSYIDAAGFQTLSSTGSTGGVGLELRLRDHRAVVLTAIDGTPAARAGIVSGSTLLAIDGKELANPRLSDVVDQLRGEPGSHLALQMLEPGAAVSRTFTLVRERIKAQAVRGVDLGDGYAYVRISQFQLDTGKQFSETLAHLKNPAGGELKGLVLDLRNNPGGVLNAAIDVSDALLENGPIAKIHGRDPVNDHEFDATRGDDLDGHPLVVLVNGGTASGSELVAAALQDHHRAWLLGQHTFGSSDIQTIMPMPSGSAIRLTTANWLRPSGLQLDAGGLTPDQPIDPETESPASVASPPQTVADPHVAALLDDREVAAALAYLKQHGKGGSDATPGTPGKTL